jgi:hypothetical protein
LRNEVKDESVDVGEGAAFVDGDSIAPLPTRWNPQGLEYISGRAMPVPLSSLIFVASPPWRITSQLGGDCGVDFLVKKDLRDFFERGSIAITFRP